MWFFTYMEKEWKYVNTGMHFKKQFNRPSLSQKGKKFTASRLYLERLNSHTSFVFLLHHFNELANHLISHIVHVSASLRSKAKKTNIKPIYRINVVNLNHSDTKWPGEQPNLYLTAKNNGLVFQSENAL